MIKQITTTLAFMASSLAFSQVGIQTQTPHASADLELGSANKTLYLNRVANPETDIANPQPGMMLYDTTLNCIRTYQGLPPAWSECMGLGLGAGSEGSITSFDCSAALFSPATATRGVAYDGYLYLPYEGGNGGRYPEDEFEVAGLTFHLPEGIYNEGSGSLVYQVTGTPTASGTISLDINQNGASCTGLSFVVNPPIGTVGTLTCASVAFAPANAAIGTPYTGTLTVPYTGGSGGTYPAQTITANGLTFTLAAGTFATGAGSVTYNISGTPVASGNTSVNITLGGQSCTGAGILTVNSPTPANPAGTGSLSGTTCFDVVVSNNGGNCGTLASRTSQKANFAIANTYQYTFTPTGTVSNVRFAFVNTKGQVIQSIAGGTVPGSTSSPVTATVTYYNNLNTAAAGLTREQALLAEIYVIYNNGSGDVQLKLTARVQDCNCCGAKISSTVFKEFLCHNLGADITADPFTPSWRTNGAYIQRGKRGPNITGDSRIDWQTAPSDGFLGFVAAPTSASAAGANAGAVPYWFYHAIHNKVWNTGTEEAPIKNKILDPCPEGYRVPTVTEMRGVATNNNRSRVGSWTRSNTNYSAAVKYGPSASVTTLMIPAAGSVQNFDGSQDASAGRGVAAYIWTSTARDYNYYGAFWLEYADSNNDGNAASVGETHEAMSVRCIAE